MTEQQAILTEISTFLAGISFASILLLYQIKDSIDPTTMLYLSGSLAFSAIFFTFCALSCILKLGSKDAGIIFGGFNFFSGFVAFFMSLYLLLSLISQVIAIISIVVAIALFIVFLIIGFSEK